MSVIDFSPFAQDVYPDVACMHSERQELFRTAAQQIMARANSGQAVDPEALKWARYTVSTTQPLSQTLSTGEPHDGA